MRRVWLLLPALLLIAACGGPDASDLRSYLHDQYRYHDAYSLLDGAKYTVDSDHVSIRTNGVTDVSDAQDVCDWVSDWLYTGDHDGTIQVLNRDGDVLSQRRAAVDACSFG